MTWDVLSIAVCVGAIGYLLYAFAEWLDGFSQQDYPTVMERKRKSWKR